MKKYLVALMMMFASVLGASAMSYEEARLEARYLTDKMAYELNLDEDQYDYAYEINLDYLLSLTDARDVYGTYLTYRNADLRSIMWDWQYELFLAADYFYRPVYWRRGAWHFSVYNYYERNYFYYSHPRVYWDYCGAHGRDHFRDGYYDGHRPGSWRGGLRGHDRPGYAAHGGMTPVHGGTAVGGGRTRRDHDYGTRAGHEGTRVGGTTPTRTGGSRTEGAHVGAGRTEGGHVGGTTPTRVGGGRGEGTYTGGGTSPRISSTRTTVAGQGGGTTPTRVTGTGAGRGAGRVGGSVGTRGAGGGHSGGAGRGGRGGR